MGERGVDCNGGLTGIRETRKGEAGVMPRRGGVKGGGDCELGTGVPSTDRSEVGGKSPAGSSPLAWKAANEVRACSSALNPRYGGAEFW